MKWSWSEAAGLLFVLSWCAGLLRWFWGFPWATKWRTAGVLVAAAVGAWVGLEQRGMEPGAQARLLVSALIFGGGMARVAEWIATHPPKGSESEVGD